MGSRKEKDDIEECRPSRDAREGMGRQELTVAWVCQISGLWLLLWELGWEWNM